MTCPCSVLLPTARHAGFGTPGTWASDISGCPFSSLNRAQDIQTMAQAHSAPAQPEMLCFYSFVSVFLSVIVLKNLALWNRLVAKWGEGLGVWG